MAITLFGHIFTHKKEDAEKLNNKYDALKNHEMIHLRQAQSTHNSWFLFYILYTWYSLRAITYIRRMKKPMYYLNPFEIEAYAHMYDLHYLEQCRDGANEWRKYADMSLAARMRYVRKAGIAP